MQPSTIPPLEAVNLSQTLGRTPIFSNLSLSLDYGVHGLLGPNGAGKTTLIRTLATVLPPTGGTLRLARHPVESEKHRRAARRHLGYLPQVFGYHPDFTVAEFVRYMALLKEVAPDKVGPRTAWAIEQVGLTARAATPLRTLSGGMLRRVGIAQAMVNDPEILLLDEPTVGLDPHQRIDFRQLLRTLGTERVVVVSTHLVEDVAASCTSVVVLHGGVIRFRGTPEALRGRGHEQSPGDTPLERGYSAVLAEDAW